MRTLIDYGIRCERDAVDLPMAFVRETSVRRYSIFGAEKTPYLSDFLGEDQTSVEETIAHESKIGKTK